MNLSLNAGVWISFVICEPPFVSIKLKKKKKESIWKGEEPTKRNLIP